MTERERFEAWARSNRWSVQREMAPNGHDYEDEWTDCSWMGWQAASRATVVDYEKGAKECADGIVATRAILDAAIVGAVSREDVRVAAAFIESHQRCYELDGECGAEPFVMDSARRILSALGVKP